MIRKIGLGIVATFVILVIVYLVGPHPSPPSLLTPDFKLPDSTVSLDNYVKNKESKVQRLRADNEARIVWADSLKKEVSDYAVLYIHGFSASQEEGAPVHRNVARTLKANLYLARLDEHGINAGDESMAALTADKLVNSAEEALAITRKLGKKVIVIGTSMGGALATYLASKHPEIEALVLYSPCVAIYDPNAAALDNPWGLQLAKQIKGSDFNDTNPKNEMQSLYWTTHYRLEAVVALQNLLTHTMLPETFSKVTCPVYMAYYYKDEENQDKVVSVPAMLEMYGLLGTPEAEKKKEAFPATGNHVIASHIMSADWQSVEKSTIAFIQNIVL